MTIEQPFAVINLADLNLPERFCYPHVPEQYTDTEKEVLSRFFSNCELPVFAIHSLPQEVIGALFSRYSRSEKSARRLFLDEFWASEELGINNIANYLTEEKGISLEAAMKRANKFYKRVFAEYGDKSVIQMGSVHIAFEGVSQIAEKEIEDGRVASAYIAKSTRYVPFLEQQNGHDLCVDEPRIAKSEFGQEFKSWNERCFALMRKHMPITEGFIAQSYPIESQEFQDTKSGKVFKFGELDAEDQRKATAAYRRAVKAKALDTLRVFLPTTTVTNLGAHFSGQAAENMVNKLLVSSHPEVRLVGVLALKELLKVAPNFLQNVDHKYGDAHRKYLQELNTSYTRVARDTMSYVEGGRRNQLVRLVDCEPDAEVKIASAILFASQREGKSKRDIYRWTRKVKDDWVRSVLLQNPGINPNLISCPTLVGIIESAVPDRAPLSREEKLTRAFEHAFLEVEFDTDWGIFRDLQRNRLSTTERGFLSAQKVTVPKEFYGKGMEFVLADYLALATSTKELNVKLRDSNNQDLVSASEYVTLFGNKLRYTIRANLRQWAFFSELRTIPGGHPSYRLAMQHAVRQILYVMPWAKRLFAKVDWRKDYGLGRLRAEYKTQSKLQNLMTN